MKRIIGGLVVSALLIAAPLSIASAADMPLKAPPPVPPPVYSRTGCYVGGNAGAGWDNISTERTGQVGIPLPAQYYGSDSGSGFVGGAQVGCDYQVQSWVLGIRGQGDWGKINSSHIIPPFPSYSYNTTMNDFATLTGRVGYTVVPQVLLYMNAGGAWKSDHLDVTIPTIAFLSEFADVNFTRWTVGGGLEWMILPYLSFFVEYSYMNFGTQSVTFTPGPTAVGPGDIINHSQNVSAVLAGFNLRCCAGGPIFAK